MLTLSPPIYSIISSKRIEWLHMMSCDFSLKSYAIQLYGKKGVADCCIGLQDGYGLDANILLTLCWLAECGVLSMEAADLEHLIRRAAPLQVEVIQPLRKLRRQLKLSWHAALYESVKQAELAAEFEELAILEKASGTVRLRRTNDSEKRKAAEKMLTGYILFQAEQSNAGIERAVHALLDAAFPL